MQHCFFESTLQYPFSLSLAEIARSYSRSAPPYSPLWRQGVCRGHGTKRREGVHHGTTHESTQTLEKESKPSSCPHRDPGPWLVWLWVRKKKNKQTHRFFCRTPPPLPQCVLIQSVQRDKELLPIGLSSLVVKGSWLDIHPDGSHRLTPPPPHV